MRSHQFHRVEKLDIWDSKNMFRNSLKKALRLLNPKYKTIEELELAILQMIKLWI